MPWKKFYWSWVTRTFSKAWAISGLVVGVLRFLIPLVITPLAQQYFPVWVSSMTSLAWEIPFWIFVGFCAIRVFFVPYWMDQEQEQAKVTLQEKLNCLLENPHLTFTVHGIPRHWQFDQRRFLIVPEVTITNHSHGKIVTVDTELNMLGTGGFQAACLPENHGLRSEERRVGKECRL